MTIEEQRIAISKVYPTNRWKNNVKNMTENQVVAIYLAFKQRGLLDKVIKKPCPRKMEENKTKKMYQMTFADFLGDGEGVSIFELKLH